MNYWLIKSDPETYSIEQMKKEKTTLWNGVRNYAARNNLQAMKLGDLCLFYNSVKNPGVAGIVKVVKEAYQDPTTDETAWVAVDVEYVSTFNKEVTLPQIKETPKLKDMDLLRLSRLSVQSVKKAAFDLICKMGE